MRAVLNALPLGLVVCCLLLTHSPVEAGPITVSGHVYDVKGKPIPGVHVTIWSPSNGMPVDAADTDKNGYYMMKPNINSAFDLLYSNTGYEFVVIPRLSDQKDQSITKVLYAKGSANSADAALEQIQSAENLVFLLLSVEDKEKRTNMTKTLTTLGVERLLRKEDVKLAENIPARVQMFLKARASSLDGHEKLLAPK